LKNLHKTLKYREIHILTKEFDADFEGKPLNILNNLFIAYINKHKADKILNFSVFVQSVASYNLLIDFLMGQESLDFLKNIYISYHQRRVDEI
jgi:hypothetical protein